MKRSEAERLTSEYLKSIFGYAVKRCRTIQDAEDLSQEIALKIFRTFLLREDISEPENYIRRTARNCLVNYYRGRERQGVGIPLEDICGLSEEPDGDFVFKTEEKETEEKLKSEIAYLSGLRRQIIIAYYYENKKQSEIAEQMGIPLGTVKWHLFEAKKELKRGMEMERKASELKFNPVIFDEIGFNGNVGEKDGGEIFLRSALAQNIVYLARREEKTIAEMADSLGVSPVYAESEAELLEEYGFLIKRGQGYLSNVLIDEPDAEINALHDRMYSKAAELFANDLYARLAEIARTEGEKENGLFGAVKCGVEKDGKRDVNYLMWALIPYIAAVSGEKDIERGVSFEEAATLRPDGGCYISSAVIRNPDAAPVKYAESLKKWNGPFWRGIEKITFWGINSEWSEERSNCPDGHMKSELLMLKRLYEGEKLTEEEYSVLAEQGYIKCENGQVKSLCAVIDEETKKRLLEIGGEIKSNYKNELRRLKKPYVEAVMAKTPEHMKKAREFGHQYIFYSDGRFILYCLKTLVENGKLKLPSEEQRKSLSTVIVLG